MAISELKIDEQITLINRELGKLEIGFGWSIGPRYLPELTNKISWHIRGYVWSEKLGKHTVSYPKDWWEALKQRFAPEWLLQRWPVECTKVVLEASALYPD